MTSAAFPHLPRGNLGARRLQLALAAVEHDAFAVPFVESRLRSSPELQRTASRALERSRSHLLTRDQIDRLGVCHGQVSPGGLLSQRSGSRGFLHSLEPSC